MIQQRRCRKAWPKTWAATACALFGIALAVPAASLAQVYKCPVAHGSVYQSTPCANDPKAPPHIAKPADVAPLALPANMVVPLTASQLSSMDLSAIRQALLADDVERKKVEDEFRAAQLAWQRTAGKVDPQERMRQSSALDAHRNTRHRQLDARDQSLNDELARRCPHGATIGADRIDCRK